MRVFAYIHDVDDIYYPKCTGANARCGSRRLSAENRDCPEVGVRDYASVAAVSRQLDSRVLGFVATRRESGFGRLQTPSSTNALRTSTTRVGLAMTNQRLALVNDWKSPSRKQY